MAAAAVQKAPSPPASKPSGNEAIQPSASQSAATAATKSAPTGPKPNRIQPAIPLQSPANAKTPLQSNAGNIASPPAATPASLRDATQAATAAVAAAMAKLPQANGSGNAMDNLTKKVNEMRTNDHIRAPRQPGSNAGFERGRGRGRGGARNTTQKVEVPATDFDFESSNAKFNKQDLVKEAVAGSPLGENPPSTTPSEPDVLAPGYNKTKSFFDDISSESKERADGAGNRPGGREWRGEEQKKNVETFGQGSVDNGAYRGRGRGRGRGYRGRGYGGNGQPQRARGGYGQ
jgi:protein LSM14